MPTIRPMADLRDTGKISELCYQKNEPVFITKNGSGHLVVMSMDTYEKQLGILDVYRKLGAAEKQLEDGVPLLDGDEVIKRLREKLEGVSDKWELKTVWGVGYKFESEEEE